MDEKIPTLSFGVMGVQELLVILLMFALTAIVVVLPFWFLFKRAGFHPPMSLLAFVPLGIGPIALLFILAFAPWPKECENSGRPA
jgi:hypothetical protein